MTKRKPKAEHKKDGRPTDYKEEYNDLAFKYCLLGADDKTLASYFEVAVATINNWKKDYPEFLVSIKAGKDEADANVGNSLYQRACGYSHIDTKFATHEGKITDTKEYTKHYAPDPVSMIFWLKNRQKDKWRDKTEQDINIKGDLASMIEASRGRVNSDK